MLARFAGEHGIGYDLLSDEGSAVIEALGLLNRHTKAQQRYFNSGLAERHERIPYPGTFILDEQGVIVERLFEQSFRDRPGAGYVLRQASGVPARPAVSAHADDSAVAVTAWLDSETFRPLEVAEVHLEIRVAQGWHVYVPPTPAGYTALSAELQPAEGLTTWPVEPPAGRPFAVDGLAEGFQVLDGSLLLHLPFRLSGGAYLADGRNRPDPRPPAPVEIVVEVRYQACSDTECLPPAHVRLPFSLDEEPRTMPSP